MQFVFILVLVGLAFGDDNDCHTQLGTVRDCVVKQKDTIVAKMEGAKTDIGACFTSASCDAPDFDGNGGMPGQMMQQFQDQPDTVKDCIKNNMKTAALAKLNECLTSKNVKPIDVNEMDDHDVFDDQRHGGDHEKMAKAMMAIMMAVKKCQDKGDDKRKAAMDCMKPIKDKVKADVCKTIGDCKSGVSQACLDRGKEIKDAVCQCKVDKMKIAQGKIEDLQKTGQDVNIDDLKDLPSDGPGGMGKPDVSQIEKCYNDNNVPVPPMLLAMKVAGSGGPGGLLKMIGPQDGPPKITQAQLGEIHDHLAEQIQNPDCGC